MKKKRKIVAFEPEPDVREMLDKAQKCGLTMSDIMNEAVREYGIQVISDLAKQQMAKLKKLASPSFNKPDCQPVGDLELAA